MLELRHLKAFRVEKLPPELTLWEFLACHEQRKRVAL